jgi:type IV secretory pathway VirB10-like protein
MMGKRKKRMMKAKYAKKYALKRKNLGFNARRNIINGVVTIDMNTSEEVKEEKQVEVVVNDPVVEKEDTTPPWDPQPELELLQVEEPEVQEVAPPPPKKKPTRRRKTTTTTKKTTPARKTTTRRRSTKKTAEA